MVQLVGAPKCRRWRYDESVAPVHTLKGDMIMTRTIIAALTALSLVAGIAATASAHRPKPTPTASQGFDGKTFWDQQQNNTGQ